MQTKYTVISVAGDTTEHTVDWPDDPGYDRIRTLVEPLLGADEPLEHVAVLYNGERRDMFVSELGNVVLTTRGPLPVNTVATTIYRANWLNRHPETDPDSMSAIHGVAVLFTDREVWR